MQSVVLLSTGGVAFIWEFLTVLPISVLDKLCFSNLRSTALRD